MVVVTSITNMFFKKIESIKELNQDIFNNKTKEIESQINYIVKYINRFKKVKIMELELKQATSFNDIVEVLNENITLMNDFLVSLSNDVYDNKITSIANMGTISDIAFLNDSLKGYVDVTNNELIVNINKKEPIIINDKNIQHKDKTIIIQDKDKSWLP